MANGSDSNCTISVGNVGPYLTSYDSPEIIDQINNPSGSFNISQLHQQAKQLPYVMTDIVMNRSDIMMLYSAVLPGRPVPDTSFLYESNTTPTTSVTPIPTVGPEGSVLYVTGPAKINHLNAKILPIIRYVLYLLYHNLITIYTTATKSSSLL